MKKIFNYLGVLLSVALMGAFTACNPVEENFSDSQALGIKVFFPTKVVAGQPMTINGSGFSDAVEVVFPDGISVRDFDIVTSEMIRVTAPAGISAQGGKIMVRTAKDEAESRISLTLGNTSVTGFSKQAGETFKGNELLTIYGEDLEFISSVTLLDSKGNPLILNHEDFYRKGTRSVVIIVPKDVYEGAIVGKISTFDGREFLMDEFLFEPDRGGGYWDVQRDVIWENDGSKGAISWSSDYRFSSANASTGEEIYAIPMDLWERMKSETFYMTFDRADAQIRVTTGWWSTTWTGDDLFVGNDKITENADGTFTLAVNLAGDPILDVIDAQHLLFTGDRYTPAALFFETRNWVEGDGPTIVSKEIPIWESDGSKGAISWSSDYRFSSENATSGEEIAAIPMDVWERMKSETFYLKFNGPDAQIRVTTGWWSTTWTGDDIFVGDDRITQNEDGSFTLAINLAGDPILDVIDAQHLLFTGDRYTPIGIYFIEETVIEGGSGGGSPEVVFWENDDTLGEISWNSDYRFGLEGHDANNECLATFPQDVWDVITGGKFYLVAKGSDWVQMRITTGWWSTTWTGDDITTGSDRIVDNGDGTYTIEINFDGDPIKDVLDVQHLLLTGSGYTPVKLYYVK